MRAGRQHVINLLEHGQRALVPIRRERRVRAVPTPVLFTDYFPEVLEMRIARVQKCFSPVPMSKFETFVRVTIAGKNMVPGAQLLLGPSVRPAKQSKTQCLGPEWREH